jgi:hypothetical protein
LAVVAGDVSGGKAKIRRALAWDEEMSPNPADATALGKRLRERLNDAKISPAPVLACVGRDRVILKELRYPAVTEAEEPAVVRFQAFKELTDAAEDVVLDYVPNGSGNGGERRTQVLIARRELVESYKAICHAAGLKLAALTPRPFGAAAAVRRAMAAAPPLEDGGAVAFVAIGEGWAEFGVLKGAAILLTRPMASGPGLPGEIRRNLTVFGGQVGRPPVHALYIAGATPELRERLGDLIDTPIHSFDVLAGAESPDLPSEGRGGFAGAAGLLYAQAEAAGLPINFVRPREPKPPVDPRRPLYLFSGVGAAAVVFAAVLGCWAIYTRAAGKLPVVAAQRDELDRQLAELRKDSKLDKALDDWDTVVMPDELWNLTALMDIKALRVSSLSAEPLPRTAKARYNARITLKGTLLDSREPRRAIDDLVAALRQDPYYSPEAPKIIGNQFTLVVNVERRPPGDYDKEGKYKLEKPPAPPARPELDLGGGF